MQYFSPLSPSLFPFTHARLLKSLFHHVLLPSDVTYPTANVQCDLMYHITCRDLYQDKVKVKEADPSKDGGSWSLG